MNYDPITQKDLDFLDLWFTPKCLLELLFHDWDNLNSFDDKKCGELRLYQYSMVSDESIIDWELTAEHNNLSKKESFRGRQAVGDLYCFGARKFGKSLVVMVLDLLDDMMTSDGNKVAMASVDLIHIRQILDPVKTCLQTHPICSLFERRITGAPDYKFELKNNYVLNSVNFNIGSKSPGQQWYGKHVFKVYIEEASLETEDVYDKRKDALSELGAVIRCSGMTDFTPHSPAGEAFYEPNNEKHIINYPQYVSPLFDLFEKNKRLEQYGGETSVGFRVFVKGEVVEDGVTAIDMQRVKSACYDDTKTVIHFEISKDRFKHFNAFISVSRPTNSERIFINSDIGQHVTEINIMSEVKGKYEYLYNITLNNLTDDEQSIIFKYLAGQLEANVIAIDCGDGMGRAIYNELEKTIPVANLVWYDGSKKIQVGFDLDKEGNVIFDSNGDPVYKYEYMSEWSVKRLKDLLYQGQCIIPSDYKFTVQFSKVISMMSGTRTIYKCTSQQGDHLFDSFKVFAIAEWLKHSFNDTPNISSDWGTGAVN